MKLLSLYRVELGRTLRGRLFWLVAALTALSPLAGYALFRPTIGDSMSALYLANPMLTGGLAGTMLFAILTLATLDNPRRSGVETLTNAIISPLRLCGARLLALETAGALTALVVGLLYLPYTAHRLDIVFSLTDYALSVALFLCSGIGMGTLIAAAIWQLVGRLDVSLLMVLAALLLSRGPWFGGQFLPQWSVPLVPTLSDAFGSAIVWRTALYSRAVWLCLLGGGWILTLLCVRQYGKGALGSFLRHARRIAVPVLALLLVCTGGILWVKQPFVDHTPANWQELMEAEVSRFNETLTLEKTELAVSIDSYLLGTMSGKAAYSIHNSSGKPQDVYLELNSGYAVRSVTANRQAIPFEDLNDDMIASRELRCTLPADEMIALEVRYGGMPRMWNVQEGQLAADVISRESVTLVSKTLAPTLLGSTGLAEQAPVSLTINLDSRLTPVGTGTHTRVEEHPNGTTSWLVENRDTDRLFLYAADYVARDLDAGNGTGIPFFYSAKYAPRLERGALDLMEEAVGYCTERYGPRTSGADAFSIIQTTAFDFGGFAVSGISGMGETYFSDENLNDPEKGPASAEILAHEIIHQWWGLGVTLTDPADEGWTDEGITTYTTYRLMRELMGEEYAQEHYVDKWQATMDDVHASFYQRNPEYLGRLPERYRAELCAEIDGANRYDGTALMIHQAAQKIGEEKMDEVWAKLFTNGGTELPPYITLGNFLSACGLTREEVHRG